MLETLTCTTVPGEQPSKQEGGGRRKLEFFPSLGGSERKEGRKGDIRRIECVLPAAVGLCLCEHLGVWFRLERRRV